MKYKVQLSMYGSVAERADIVIEAETKEAAEKKALEMSEACEVEFTNNQESMDGWQYQVEDCQEVKENV